jgi:hypothetical protein
MVLNIAADLLGLGGMGEGHVGRHSAGIDRKRFTVHDSAAFR